MGINSVARSAVIGLALIIGSSVTNAATYYLSRTIGGGTAVG